MQDRETSATITGNAIHDVGKAGVGVRDGANASVVGNNIVGGHFGISINGEGAAGTVSANTIQDVSASAITIERGAAASVSDNTVGAVAGPQIDSGFDGGDGLSVSRELGSAPSDHPLGSALLEADLELKLPVAIGAGTYNATLTLTALS